MKLYPYGYWTLLCSDGHEQVTWCPDTEKDPDSVLCWYCGKPGHDVHGNSASATDMFR